MGFPLAVARPATGDRLRDVSILFGLVLWLVYTRVYWTLHIAHVTLPPCPFYYLTGHPCPFCGGTRSFAFMWQGDLANAVRLYPLGPALFAGSIAGVFGLSLGLVSGRTWSVRLTSMQWRLVAFGVVTIVAMTWALKFFVLGN